MKKIFILIVFCILLMGCAKKNKIDRSKELEVALEEISTTTNYSLNMMCEFSDDNILYSIKTEIKTADKKEYTKIIYSDNLTEIMGNEGTELYTHMITTDNYDVYEKQDDKWNVINQKIDIRELKNNSIFSGLTSKDFSFEKDEYQAIDINSLNVRESINTFLQNNLNHITFDDLKIKKISIKLKDKSIAQVNLELDLSIIISSNKMNYCYKYTFDYYDLNNTIVTLPEKK